jgi:serine/threonine protein kinase
MQQESDPATALPDAQSGWDSVREGMTVGRYRLGREIGRGGCGVVHEATEIGPMTRRVAVKIVRAGRRGGGLEAALREARALERLSHPMIARVHDAGMVDAASAFVAMDHVEGPTLSRWLADAEPSGDERLRVFVELCEAVGFAHAKGILHRDIKPSNVLMARDADGRVHPVLVDFGLASLVGTATDGVGPASLAATDDPCVRPSDAEVGAMATMTVGLPGGFGYVSGTPEVMAPELLEGDDRASSASFDMRSEVYALGATLHHLVSGSLPFSRRAEESLPGLLARIRAGYPREGAPWRPAPALRLPRGATDDLRAVLSLALARDPAERYRSVAELEDEVRRIRRGEPTFASRGGARPRLRRAWHTHRRTGSVIGLVLVAAAATGWFALAEAAARRESDRLRGEQEASLAALESANARANEAVAAVGDTLMRVLREFRVLATSRQLADTMPKVVEAFAAVYGTDDKRTNSQRLFLSEAQLAAYRWPEAEVSLRALEAYALARLPETHPSVMRIRRGLVEALEGQGRTDEAIALLRTLLAQVPSLDSPCNGVVHPFYLRVLLGELLIADGGCDEGVGELEAALQQAIECTGRRSHNVLTATVSLGIGLARCGRDDEAVAALGEGARLGEGLGEGGPGGASAESWTVRARCHSALITLRRANTKEERATICEGLARDLARWDELRGLSEKMRQPFVEALAREGIEWPSGGGTAARN